MPEFIRRLLARGVSIVPILLGMRIVRSANGSRERRHRQLLMPFVAIIAILAMLPTMATWGERIVWLKDLISTHVPLIGPLIGSMDTAFFAEMAFNFMFLLGFAGVKLIYRGIVRVQLSLYETLLARVIGIFYVYDDTYDTWVLRESCQGIRMIVRNLYYAVFVVSALFYVLAPQSAESLASRNGFYPCFVILVLAEMWFALDGVTKKEYEDTVEVDPDQARRIFGYAKLQAALRHYFDGRLLYGFTHGAREPSFESHDDVCEKLAGSEDHAEQVAGEYFRAVLNEGLVGEGENAGTYDELSHDRMVDTVRLLQGQSVLFASPFYRDFVPYLFPAINAQLLKNRKALFICGTDDSKDRLTDYIYEGISFVTNFPDMWKVDELSRDGLNKTDIGLLSFISLDDVRLITNNREFLKKVSIVVIVDPSSLLATYQLGLGMLASELARGERVTYCAFDRNSDGLVDSLSHALRTHLVEVGATEYATGDSFGMFWSVDGEQLQNRLLPGVTHYLGVGSELGLVALKNQVNKVSWAAHDSVPLADMRWILGQYYGEAFSFAELPQEQAQVDKSFEFCSDLWSMGREPRRFVVVEDEYNNMFEAYRQYATRGSKETFVNVLAPQYLLRNYMASNSTMFAADPKAIPSIAPDYAKSVRNTVFSIVMEMLQTGRRFPEDELVDRLRYVGVQVSKSPRGVILLETLKGLIVEHFAAIEQTTSRSSSFFEPQDYLVRDEVEEYDFVRKCMQRRVYVRLDGVRLERDSVSYQSFSGLRNVPLITEMPDGSEKILGSRLSSLVCQSWLPGQFITLDGKYYEVLAITAPQSELDRGSVLLRRAADHFLRRVYYKQLRGYEVGIWKNNDDISARRVLHGVRITLERAEIAVRTLGYLEMNRRGDLRGAHKVEVTQPEDVEIGRRGKAEDVSIPVRNYVNKDTLKLEFPDAEPDVVRTIATVMSELFVTLFPKDHQYLSVLTPTSGCLPEGVLDTLTTRDGFDDIPDNVILVVEDSLVDIGLVSAVNRNVRRILETCWDYLDWHLDMMAGIVPADPKFDPGEPPEMVPQEPRRGGILGWIRDLFGRRRDKKKPEPTESAGPEPEEPSGKERGPEADEGAAAAAGPESESAPEVEPVSALDSDPEIEPETAFMPVSEPKVAPEPEVEVVSEPASESAAAPEEDSNPEDAPEEEPGNQDEADADLSISEKIDRAIEQAEKASQDASDKRED